MNYQPFCSTEIVFSNKETMINKLFSIEDSGNIVLVMSETSASRWNMLSFIEQLQIKCKMLNATLTWIKKVPVNPTQKDIIRSLQQIGNKAIDLIIAFGGGSGIDLAKGISAFHRKDKNAQYTADEITDSINHKFYKDTVFTDIIALPSTAGTGSEVTQWATIWDENKTGKFSIDTPGIKPKMAIIVPELTLSMPSEMTISTGLDAMCQAIESYWSRHTTPIVQQIAYRAVELSIKNLRNAVEHPDDLIVRENLCKASLLAGLAFSQTRTTACHSISYPLTMFYGIPHGLAASITLDSVGKINKGHFTNDQELFALFEEHGSINNWIDMVCEGVIDMRLSSFGLTERDIPLIVDNAFTGGRMDNNPVDLSKEDVFKILKATL